MYLWHQTLLGEQSKSFPLWRCKLQLHDIHPIITELLEAICVPDWFGIQFLAWHSLGHICCMLQSLHGVGNCASL